ncbi:LysM peptidoglycan-binding domain-containing protein [Synechococcus sp. CS-1333]|uniref:LysM peptidoglycan-binding domain-containing protein n=1 Tax=Synechococcus sp. CS-1333 TaxID=2848638 RepID=UPI00223BB2D4|nr:LysM peptidoglycan-binding domain-containing protein [Synechococcus sp. CS-1333]MCT0210635.1 LysM peptidoglycan-binding domain-containing protein [Synechococcus sp. CS-1333]
MRRAIVALALALLLPLPGLAAQHVVKPGETLSEIAERYGVSLNRLMQLNGIKDPDLVTAGTRLTVPGGASSGAGSSAGGRGSYTVKPGETLSEIADRLGTTVQRLIELNGIRDPDMVAEGTRLVVPGAPAAARPAAVNRNAREHTVQPGETLSGIADRYGVPMSRLMALNKLSQPDEIQAGSRLVLRASTPAPARAAAKPAPAKPAAAKPAPARPAPAAPQPKPAPVAARPAPTATAQPKPAPAAQPAPVRPAPAATATAVQPRPAAAAATQPAPAATRPAPAAAAPQPRPAAAAAPAPRPKPAATAARSAGPKPPEWRTYGPLQVDFANWQPLGGSMVAPALNSAGQSIFLAVNCTAGKLNATGEAGAWKSWDAPQSEFEQQLVRDLCRVGGG